jgi:hypothetical protein
MFTRTEGAEKIDAWDLPLWTPHWIEEKASAAGRLGGFLNDVGGQIYLNRDSERIPRSLLRG